MHILWNFYFQIVCKYAFVLKRHENNLRVSIETHESLFCMKKDEVNETNSVP